MSSSSAFAAARSQTEGKRDRQEKPQEKQSKDAKSPTAEQIAEERSIRINDSDRDEVLRGSELATLTAVPEARSLAYDFADQSIVAERLGAEEFLAEIGRRDVTLNPRFGVLDPATKQIAEASSGSLSVPADA